MLRIGIGMYVLSPPSWTPSQLFSAGQQGGYYDTSDASVRYIERTGAAATTPAGVGDPLGTILDKSPNANHVTAPSDAARPTVGDDGVVHAKPDGVDDVMTGPSLDGIGFPWTLACWINPASFGAFNGILGTHVGGGTGGYNGINIQISDVGQVAVRYGNGQGTSAGNRRSYITENTLAVDQWSFIYAECRGYDDVDIYINNLSQTFTISGSAATVSFAGGNIELYAETSINNYSPNKQSRALIYRGVLSAADRTRLYELGP